MHSTSMPYIYIYIYIGSSVPDKCVVNTWANGSKNNAIRSKKGLGGYGHGFPGVSFILSFSLPVPSQVILNWFLFSCKSQLTVYSSCLMWQFNPFLNATMLLLECPWSTNCRWCSFCCHGRQNGTLHRNSWWYFQASKQPLPECGRSW